MTTLNNLKANLAETVFGISLANAHARNICVSCKSPIRDERGMEETGENGQIYSDAGWKEYRISGLCETCFDNATRY